MKIARMVADVKVLPIYICEDCDREQAGSTMFFKVDTDAGESIDHILSLSPPSSCMPVGWASYGQGHIKCPRCVK